MLSNLRKYFRSDSASASLWIATDWLGRAVIVLVVDALIARYLGPAQFGVLSVGLAALAVCNTAVLLGQEQVLLRRFVSEPDATPNLLGTATLARLVMATVLAVSAFVFFMQHRDDIGRLVFVILASSLLFRSALTIKPYLLAQGGARALTLCQLSGALGAGSIRAVTAIFGASVLVLAATYAIEAALVAVLLLIVSAKYGSSPGTWRLDSGKLRLLLRESWPLAVSSVAIGLYMRVDQFMVAHFLGSNAAGLYGAAARVSEALYIIPTAVVGGVAPHLFRLAKDQEQYRRAYHNLFRGLAAFSFLASALAVLLADHVIALAFGNAYLPAAPALAIHSLGLVFVSLGLAQNPWSVEANLNGYVLVRTVGGLLMNIALSLLLIPRFGLVGAAVGTVVSYAFAAVFFNALFVRTRDLFLMQLRAFAIWR